ncbi:hypothetical protein TIFTF001_043707 [Ficus carica]|uniref:Uncharacterized protein n=1 Tax=Ficus carica TaxID=3494 RepID=A0AA87YV04_FICCA|nr:hypothetical protein TIFTF001_043707 [Ficus carica]
MTGMGTRGNPGVTTSGIPAGSTIGTVGITPGVIICRSFLA